MLDILFFLCDRFFQRRNLQWIGVTKEDFRHFQYNRYHLRFQENHKQMTKRWIEYLKVKTKTYAKRKIYRTMHNINWGRKRTCSINSLTSLPSLLLRAEPSSTLEALSANLRVLKVSEKDSTSGFICTNIKVFARPPLKEN